jgi:anti-sigma factor ChrR (cupin superfamily)
VVDASPARPQRISDAELELMLTRLLAAERVALDRLPTPQRRRELSRAVNLAVYLAALHAHVPRDMPAGALEAIIAIVKAACDGADTTAPGFMTFMADFGSSKVGKPFEEPWAQHVVAAYRERFGG